MDNEVRPTGLYVDPKFKSTNSVKELTLEEKRVCIAYMINLIPKEQFICHCFSVFMYVTDVFEFKHSSEHHMHIIFPELYQGLKDIHSDINKYNANNNRRNDGDFNQIYKCALWNITEVEERIHFLNDLNDSLN